MLFNIIMFVGMYPVVFIMYFVLKLNVKNRGGTVFGLCVPKDKDFAEEFYGQVNQRKKWYQYRMKQILLLLLVLPLITLKIPYVSLQFTFWMFWLVGGIVLMELPTVRVNRELKAFKKKKRAEMLLKQESEIAESGGSDKKSDYVRLVELSEAGQVRKTRLLPFLVPTLLSAAAVIYSFVQSGEHGRRQMVFVVLLFALCTPMFYMMASWMDRQRTAVVSYESEVNVNYARAKKQIWNRTWLMCAWVNTVFTIFSAFALGNDSISSMWLIWGMILYMLLTLLGALYAVRKVNRLERRYEKKIDPLLNDEDDDCWILGMFYYNKADRRTFVETRIGCGMNTNMATPLGKMTTALGAIAILSLPVVCIWMMFLEFTPLKLNVQENYLVAEQLKTDYRIALSDIREPELVDSLPEMSKNVGTGMDNLYKGNWHITYNGDCEVFLNPKNHLFIKFTVDGELYYMSAADDKETRAVYEELTARLGTLAKKQPPLE